MKKIRFFSLILIICLIFSVAAPGAWALDEPEMSATAVVLADLETGRLLYGKNMTEKVAPASLTKIMSILIAVEAIESGEIDPEKVVTAQSDCRVGMDDESSTSGIIPGEEMSFLNLMYCALLQSANEACNIIGTELSGSISAFVDRMNTRAAALGCTGTHFANTNGLTDEQHYTTAYDFYLIAREAIRHGLFMDICNTQEYVVPETNMCSERRLANSNALISDKSIYGSDYLYEGTSGVKTGYTRAAGYCLISTCAREDIRVMGVVMGSTGVLNSDRQDYGNFVDSITLYDWAFENFEYRTVLANQPLAHAEVQLSRDGEGVSLYPSEEMTALLPKDVAESDIQVTTRVFDDKLVAPIASGTVLGEVTVSVNGEKLGTAKLVNITSVEMSKSEYMKMRLKAVLDHGWFKTVVIILAVFVLGYALLVVRYRILRRKHIQERRRAEQQRRAQRERQAAARQQRRADEEASSVRHFPEDGEAPEDSEWKTL